ncbi:MAG: zinc-ribbon domain-containing protein [Deltaproteobacteria bacterium]|nr:zinc-ribbon domain-containing protein [Deltaproteobacteria bacterium]
MIITCPSCSHTDDVDESLIPANAVRVVCKQCGNKFPLLRPAAASTPPPFTGAASAEKTIAYYQADNTGHKAPPPTANAPQNIKESPAFRGSGEQLFILYLVTMLLSAATLGIYYFWGKIKIRKYIYGQTEFLGDRFQFTGTGLELFIGWLKAVGLLAILIVIPNQLSTFVSPVFGILSLLGFLLLVPIALVGSRRYKLTRTTWQGIKFSFTGSIGQCFKVFALGYFLTGITFSIYYPYLHASMQEFLRGNTRYGSTPFAYDGKGGDLIGSWVITMLLFIPTLGIMGLWFRAKRVRYDWEHTTFDNMRFKCSITPGKYIGFEITNYLILIFTAWIAYPWVLARRMRFNIENLSLEGTVDFEKIRQTADQASATGEGLMDSFEMDFGFGI